MRVPVAAVLISLALVACGSVDDPPLGGPFGGTTAPTDPNAANGNNPSDPNNPDPNNNNNTGTDAGTTQSQDSGTTQSKDSGTTQSKDSGTTQTQDSGTTQTQTAPTWTQIFNSYMASGTKGRCSSCHSQGSSKSSLYTWLQGRGYISGTSSALVDSSQSCLSWYGGNMPTNGPSSYSAAVSDMNAWAAAGALNN